MRFNWIQSPTDANVPGGPSLHSQLVRDEAYDVANGLIEFARSRSDLPSWYVTPIDLFEAIRCELMIELRSAARDWTTWRVLRETGAHDVQLQVPHAERHAVERDLAALQLARVVVVETTPDVGTGDAASAWKSLRESAYALRERWESRWSPREHVPTADRSHTRVLFFDQHANSTQVLRPVWTRLAKHPEYQCLYVAGRSKIRRILGNAGIPSVNLRRCRPRVTERDLQPPQWPKLLDDFLAHREKCRGFKTPPSVKRKFSAVGAMLAEAKLTALRMHHVFETFRPQAFFVSSGANVPARVGELLCRKHDATSIHLQHGAYRGDKEHRDLLADAICLWGDYHQQLMERNPSPARLTVTGSPKHDELLRKHCATPQSERPLVVFYSSRKASWVVSSQSFDRHLSAMYETARRLPDVDFVVKLHPGEHREVVDSLTADPLRPTNIRVTQIADAYDLLQRCHVAVTVSSTIGYEALLFRRPLLLVNLSGGPCELPLPEPSPATYVVREEELATELRRLLDCGNRAAPDDHGFWRNDGGALDRIVALLESQVRSRSHADPKVRIVEAVHEPA